MNAYKRVLKLNNSSLSYLNRFFIFETISFYSVQISEMCIIQFQKKLNRIESTILVQSRLRYASQIARNKNAPQR